MQRLEVRELKPVEMFEKFVPTATRNWFDRLAEWWLRKRCLIVQHVVSDWITTSKGEYVEIDLNDIRKSVHEQMHYLYGRYGIYPDTIFVGRDVDHAIRLHITNDMFYANLFYQDAQWLGMQIIVVPWMEGILLWNDDYAR